MWEQIRSNRRRSAFVITAMGIVLVTAGAALGALLSGALEGGLLGAVGALCLWLVLWLVSVRKGDDIMLRIAGAKEISKQDHPQLVNVVEEMSIASGLGGCPRVFVIDDPSPNAFATGRRPEQSAVSVTTGLLRLLNRDELQGVIAHELGHIKNRDVALMTTAGVMLGCIVLLADVGTKALWFGGMHRRSRSSGQGGGQAVMMIVAILVVILAPILAQLIYYALSRRREYLADASSAQFTRYPEGLASALEKLGGDQQPQADKSRVTAPMYIVRPLRAGQKRSLSSKFSTHPPLAERISILRSMAGGAGYAAYEQASKKVIKRSIVGARTLAAAQDIPSRGPGPKDENSPAQRARLASDAFLAGSGYKRQQCGSCSAVLKVPPSLAGRVSRCPRCRQQL